MVEDGATPCSDHLSAAGDAIAHALVGAGESLANWWLEHPEESRAAMAARLMNVAWIGLSGLLQNGVDPWPLDHERPHALSPSISADDDPL